MTDMLPVPLAPLVPADVDLRNFPYMPLDVVRLRDSDIAADPDGEVFRASVLSWCVSWHQVPAASLPDDDALLARLLGYGRDVKGWQRLRAAGALHNWIKCADGRLYHPTVAEKAIEAWKSKVAQRNRTEKARLSRLSQTENNSVTGANHACDSQADLLSQGENTSVTESVTGSKGEERRREERISSSLRSDESNSPKSARSLPDWIPAESWTAFVEMRKRLRAPITARAASLIVAKLDRLRQHGHDPGAVLDQSVMNGWRGVFELKEAGNGHGNHKADGNGFGAAVRGFGAAVEDYQRDQRRRVP